MVGTSGKLCFLLLPTIGLNFDNDSASIDSRGPKDERLTIVSGASDTMFSTKIFRSTRCS